MSADREEKDHSGHINAPHGDMRYVNENELAAKSAQFFVTKPLASNLNMAGHEVVNCETAVDDNDVVTDRTECLRLKKTYWT